jgi:hypothetical protein
MLETVFTIFIGLLLNLPDWFLPFLALAILIGAIWLPFKLLSWFMSTSNQ